MALERSGRLGSQTSYVLSRRECWVRLGRSCALGGIEKAQRMSYLSCRLSKGRPVRMARDLGHGWA